MKEINNKLQVEQHFALATQGRGTQRRGRFNTKYSNTGCGINTNSGNNSILEWF